MFKFSRWINFHVLRELVCICVNETTKSYLSVTGLGTRRATANISWSQLFRDFAQ